MSHPAPSVLAQPTDGHFVMIPLSQGKFVIVDEPDAELVLSWGQWHARKPHHTWYAHCDRRPGSIYMHNLIAGRIGVDHANRNGLDNRRVNLRPATKAQNRVNCGPSSNNKSGYKGVRWEPVRGKWIAQIGVNGRKVALGSFTDPVEAARAYNRAALEAFGEFAWLNPLPDVA